MSLPNKVIAPLVLARAGAALIVGGCLPGATATGQIVDTDSVETAQNMKGQVILATP